MVLDRDRDRNAAAQDVIGATRKAIAEYGWMVVAVSRSAGERHDTLALSYTVGLRERGLPELAVYGLPSDEGAGVLNICARRMVNESRALVNGERIGGVLPGGPELVALEMNDRSDLVMAWSLYGDVPAAVQVVWPDEEGKMPWEDGRSETDRPQPVLGSVPAAATFRAARLRVSTAAELAEHFEGLPKQSLGGGASRPFGNPASDNSIRAGRGACALIGYAQHVGGASLNGEIDTVAADLLGDLRHLFDALGIDWDITEEIAERYYRAGEH